MSAHPLRELEEKLADTKAEYSRRLNEYFDREKYHYQQFVRKVEEELDSALSESRGLKKEVAILRENLSAVLNRDGLVRERLLDIAPFMRISPDLSETPTEKIAERVESDWRVMAQERNAALARVKELEAQLSKMFDDIQEDTASLLKLRECIDDHGVWPDEQTNDDGDYEACVRHMATRLRELEEKMYKSAVNGLDALKFMGDEFSFQDTTYFRADHSRVLRGDEFRVPSGKVRKMTGAFKDVGVPYVGTDGGTWAPWKEQLPEFPTESIAALRAYWLANYQFASGEYLDEEAGVVRRREPEAKKPEPFFTDEHGDVWEFIKFRQGWCAILDTRPKRFLVYSANEDGPVADALRAYVASVGEEGE